MNKLYVLISIASFILAIVIFVYASGARRIYSGLFFTIIGIVMYLNARRGSKGEEES